MKDCDQSALLMKVVKSCYLLRLQYKNECVGQFFTAPSIPEVFEYAKWNTIAFDPHLFNTIIHILSLLPQKFL